MSNNFVHIETPRRVATGYGTRVTTAEGAEVFGIRRIDISIEPNQPIVATMEIFSAAACDAMPVFQVRHPATGQLKKVRRIEFADGSMFEADLNPPLDATLAYPRIYLDQDSFGDPAGARRTTASSSQES